MIKNKVNWSGVKRVVSSKEIVKAGLTLGIGYMVLPFIRFDEAKRYEPFKMKVKKKR